MDEVLDHDELAEMLCEGFQRAADVGMPYVHVTLAIPFRCQFSWLDDSANEHVVYLPSRAWVRPVEYQPPDLGDHAAQAKFMLHVEGGVPDGEMCGQIAEQVYTRSMQWAHAIYGDDGGDFERPPLPFELDEFASRALRSLRG